jgi:hypothetical protein
MLMTIEVDLTGELASALNRNEGVLFERSVTWGMSRTGECDKGNDSQSWIRHLKAWIPGSSPGMT